MKLISFKKSVIVLTAALLFGCGGGGGSTDNTDDNTTNDIVYDASDYLFNTKAVNHGEPLSVDQVDNTLYKRFDILGVSLNTEEDPIQEHNQEALSTLTIFDKIFTADVDFATLGPEDKLFTIITIHDNSITRENIIDASILYDIPRFYKSGDTFMGNMINNDGETIVSDCTVLHKDSISIVNPELPASNLTYNDLLIFTCDESSAGGIFQQKTTKYYIKDTGEVLNIVEKSGSLDKLYEVTFR